jgi:hypothetical protein
MGAMQMTLPPACDAKGALLLPPDGGAGERYVVEASVCPSPSCRCERVTLRFLSAVTEPAPAPAPAPVCVEVDLAERTITGSQKPHASPEATRLAGRIEQEIGEADWSNLRVFYAAAKEYATEHANWDELVPDFPPAADEGATVGYYEVLPYAKPVQFVVKGEPWVLDDQYCVKPGCACRDAVLAFVRLPFPGPTVVSAEPSLMVRYGYQRGRFELLSAEKDLSLREAVGALRSVAADLEGFFARRHALLRRLRRRVLRPRPARAQPAKAGRNDPCPCGSGKKFKHCCGA